MDNDNGAPALKKTKNKIDNQKDPYEHIESNVMGKQKFIQS